jgi:hypothetical protein
VFDSYSLLSTWTALAIYLFAGSIIKTKKHLLFFLHLFT